MLRYTTGDSASGNCSLIRRMLTALVSVTTTGMKKVTSRERGGEVDDVEHLARIADVLDEMRLFYLEAACIYVARARKASNSMDVGRHGDWWSRNKDEIEEDEYEMEEREAKKGLTTDLETRLRDVGGGLLLDKAIQLKVQSLEKQLRQVKSFAGFDEAKPPTCWRNYSQSRSWQLLPGFP
jgi:hypothetical protein